jgi:subtilase family serine protease
MNARDFRPAAALALAAAFVTGCGGGSHGGALPTDPGAAAGMSQAQAQTALSTYAGPSTLANFTWGKETLRTATYVGPVHGDMGMSVSVALKLQNERGLMQYAQEASSPKSAFYRKFLTPAEIGARYGATASDVAATAKYFNGYHISVGTWPQHLTLTLAGRLTSFEKAFGTTIGWWRAGKTTFLAPVQAPHVAVALPIAGVVGLVQPHFMHPYIIRMSRGNTIGYSPQMLANGFDYSGAYSKGYNGTGINIGIIGTGPIDTSANGDVPTLSKLFKARVATVTVAQVRAQPASGQNNNTGTGAFDPNPGGLASPPPVTDTCSLPPFPTPPDYTTCNPEDGEAQLDTEQQASLAPGANVLFYFAYNPAICVNTTTGNETAPPCGAGEVTYPLIGIQIADDEIQQAIADNKVDAVSLSYGLGENGGCGYYYSCSGSGQGTGIGPDEFAALAAEGIAVFASSGDTGNQSCFDNFGNPLPTPCVSYPASDPSVVGVGGVNAPMDTTGKLLGQIAAWAYQSTQGGSGNFNNDVGSGGGVSQVFPTPVWQQGVTTPAGSNPASPQLNGYRGVPDIALMADPFTGPALVFNSAFSDGGVGPSGGTSAAAPESAAEWALVEQACKATPSCATASGGHPERLGNPNGIFYKIYAGSVNGLSYNDVFYDVLYGQNQANSGPGAPPITGCCTSGKGYDLVTGLGVPFGGHLVQAITGQVSP